MHATEEMSFHGAGNIFETRVRLGPSGLALLLAMQCTILRRYVTMNETWIHHYTPETKRSSAEWTAAGESRPKRPKTQQWASKVMASVFWNVHGILCIDYLEKSKTSNNDYYMPLLDRLSAEIKKKRPRM